MRFRYDILFRKLEYCDLNRKLKKLIWVLTLTLFVSDKVDLIMANATDALTAASQATDTIPIVAASITDYATALGITDWNGKTGFNVTGTSDLAPLAEQAKMIKELVPTVRTLLFFNARPKRTRSIRPTL